MKPRLTAIVLVLTLGPLLAGCQQHQPSDLTFQRGAQLLAAGSPKSAIPFLTQTVASAPDGPEPLALLALAFALDLQSDRAITQAQQVRRPDAAPPGWELVAVGIARMTQHRPDEAIPPLQQVMASDPQSPIALAAGQWLVLAHILKGDHDEAIESLLDLAKSPKMKTSAMLWSVLVHAQRGRTKSASQALVQCAKGIGGPSTQPSIQVSLDDQALYDAAVAAIAAGNLDLAQRLFLSLQQRTPDASDTAVWIALIPAARGDWQAARTLLKDASQNGPPQSRGLANQLFSVVCALEDRPDAVIQHMLAGQRMLGRNAAPSYIPEQPKPESVWFSDSMK